MKSRPAPPALSPESRPAEPSLPPDLTPALLQGLRGDSSSLALLNNPAALLAESWLTPLLSRITTPAGGGPLPPLLAAADPGLLLLSTSPEGWLIGTSRQTPRPESLEAPLAAEGLIDAPLEVGGESLTVWTRLQAPGGHGGKPAERDELRAAVAGWRREADGLAWWGSHLALLDRPSASRSALARQRQLAELDWSQAPLRWVLGPETASALLREWRPWSVLSSLAGGPLAPGLHSLAVAIEPDTTPAPKMVRWTARLQFAEDPHG